MMAVGNQFDVRNSIARTRIVVKGATRRRDTIVAFAVATVTYLAVYLYAIGNLFYAPDTGFDLAVPVVDPLSHMFQPAPGQFAYEPIAIVGLGIAIYLFSPLNTALGTGLAVLVGANIALSYLAIVQPASCGVGASTGLLASIPAILSGSACCAPVVLLVLGITASGTLLTIFAWLLPVGIVLMLASLIYLASKVDPTAVT